MKIRLQSNKDRIWAISQIICAAFCLFNITELWLCFIVMTALAMFNIRSFFKHRKNEQEVENFLNSNLELNTSSNKKLSKKEDKAIKKQQYEDYLQSIEDEFEEIEDIEDEDEDGE